MIPSKSCEARGALVLALLFCLGHTVGDDAIPSQPKPRWWKGNTHTHSLWSDGNDFPEMIAEWYRTHGYNFLALSDHNVLSEGVRWMKHSEIVRRGGSDALRKYRDRFGGDWVQTRGYPDTPSFEVRLKPLNEFRALLEERGEFILLQGEEISDRSQGKPVHLNATNLKRVIPPVGGPTVRETIANNFRAVQEQAEQTGREILLHLNHPNFGLAVSAEDLAAVTAERFFEVYNGHPGVKHLGDKNHPGVEQLWDIANTIRLAKLDSPPLFGLGTDDSHKYHGKPGSRPGRGWIMVRSSYLTPEYLIRAIKSGDFYASSGVTLTRIDYDQESDVLQLEIEPQSDAVYTTQFVGTEKDFESTAQSAGSDQAEQPTATSTEIGKVLATVSGLRPRYKLTGDELYVRAVITSSAAHPDPSFRDQRQQAWTQPVGWRAQFAKQ